MLPSSIKNTWKNHCVYIFIYSKKEELNILFIWFICYFRIIKGYLSFFFIIVYNKITLLLLIVNNYLLYLLGTRDNVVFLKILKKYWKTINADGKKYYFTVLFVLSRHPLLLFVTHVVFGSSKYPRHLFFLSLFFPINSGMTLHIFISSFSSYFSFDFFISICFIWTHFVLFSFASFFNLLVC